MIPEKLEEAIKLAKYWRDNPVEEDHGPVSQSAELLAEAVEHLADSDAENWYKAKQYEVDVISLGDRLDEAKALLEYLATSVSELARDACDLEMSPRVLDRLLLILSGYEDMKNNRTWDKPG